jgi:glucose-6-phosphate isomerase
VSGVELTLPPDLERAVRARLARLEAEDFAARLERHDATLWSDDPAHQKVAANRLGWLDVPATLRAQTDALREFAAEVRGEGFARVVLLGMGGSSLAPEVMSRALGTAPGFLELEVLDSTSPAAVRAVLERGDLATTLFLVSSKSGTTVEVSCFERAAFSRVEPVRGAGAGRAFAAITDPGTPLEQLARERGYRRVFVNPPDIGGRYSALSWFGMVPAALIGADLDGLLEAALAEHRESGASAGAEQNAALRLGAALGELALAGRDKVTLVLAPPFEPLGSWIEQLLAESTGKQGKGLVPVVGEPLASPETYGRDRVFVAVTTSSPAALERQLAGIRQAGHPVLSWSRRGAIEIGAEFMRWEKATAVVGAVLGIDPFDEPNVAEAKQATRSVLDHLAREGDMPLVPAQVAAGDVEAAAPADLVRSIQPRISDPSEPNAWAAALPSVAQAGDYFAILAYFRSTPSRLERLERVREMVRLHAGLATTLGFGPRYLHSTGQLHKGGPNHGIFLELVAEEDDLEIPGEAYGFHSLVWAQGLGDYQVLERHGRRVLRLHLGRDIDRGLDALAEAFSAAPRT